MQTMIVKTFFTFLLGSISFFVLSQSGIPYTTSRTVSTVAGVAQQGYRDGKDSALFKNSEGIAVDAAGNVFVADRANDCIRKITPDGTVSTFAKGEFKEPYETCTYISGPTDLVLDKQGNIFVASLTRILKVTPDETIHLFAGTRTEGYVDGPAQTARFTKLRGMTIDASGNLFVTDGRRIRKITPQGEVSTYAGTISTDPMERFRDGAAKTAIFSNPVKITVDAQGNVYVVEWFTGYIRKISKAGIVTTIVGNKNGYFVEKPNKEAFAMPYAIVADAAGNLYVTEYGSRIYKVQPDGIVRSIAGDDLTGYQDGNAAHAQFRYPIGIALDTKGNLYLTEESRVRKISAEPVK